MERDSLLDQQVDQIDEIGVKTKLKNAGKDEQCRIEELKLDLTLVSVGTFSSVFNKKNGTPRQSGICPQSKGIVRLHKKLFNNPMHALEGIQNFGYVWILFYFHENTNKRRFIAKVRPPRLNGASCGVFASRAPVRPNSIGLTLAKIDAAKDGLLFVSGIDIIDGTPIIDIKPYIEKYDYPFFNTSIPKQLESIGHCDTEEQEQCAEKKSSHDDNLAVSATSLPLSDWVDGSVVSEISVDFTPRSLIQLAKFHPKSFHESPDDECSHCFRMFESQQECKSTIVRSLQSDPRSVYRRNQCQDRLYFFTIDSIHITAWFENETGLVEVVRVKPYVKNSTDDK